MRFLKFDDGLVAGRMIWLAAHAAWARREPWRPMQASRRSARVSNKGAFPPLIHASPRNWRMPCRTLSIIFSVNFPVKVFCWLGWYETNNRGRSTPRS